APGGSDAGAIDQDAGRAVPLARLRQRRARLPGIGHVALQRVAADLVRQRAGAVEIDVDDGDPGAGAGEFARRRCAEAGGAAGHHHGVSLDVHDQFFREEAKSGFSINSAMPWPPPMQAEAMPKRSPARLSSRASVSASRTPVAPSGWPIAIAPPLTLSLSSSRPSSRAQAITCAPKASLISKRSMSESFRSAR